MDEIRKTFNIKNDFTPEEEEHLKKEIEWVRRLLMLLNAPRVHVECACKVS